MSVETQESYHRRGFGACPLNRRFSLSFAVVLAACGIAFSGPAIACICANPDAPALEASASSVDQVFSGLIIWTERSDEPVMPSGISPDASALDPGHWIRSRVLVLRVWRGTPPVVAEVWTPVIFDCDGRPIPGSYFVALVNRDAGRDVAENSECGRALRMFSTKGPATFAIGGIVTIAAVLALGAIASVWVTRIVRRRRISIPGK